MSALLILAGAWLMGAPHDAAAAGGADERIFYARRDEDAAAVFLATLLTKEGVDPRGLPLMMRLPDRVRSAVVNLASTFVERGCPKEACDRVALHLLQHDPIANFRARAASGMWCANRAEAIPGLTAALKDAAPDVRLMACQALMLAKATEAAPAVITLLDDADASVRETAVRTLGWLGAKEALPTIRALYGKTKPRAASWVFADALGRLGDDLALEAADPQLDSANWNVRHLAALALAELKSKRVVPFLIGALPREMARQLDDWNSHGVASARTLELMCGTLAERTGAKLGADPAQWLAWWKEHHRDYGVARYEEPKDFAALLKRYTAPRVPPKRAGDGPAFNSVLAFAHEPHEGADGWSRTVGGLRIRMAPLKNEWRVGQDVELLLMMQNVSAKPIPLPELRLSGRLRHPQFPEGRTIDDVSDAARGEALAPMQVHLIVIRVRVPNPHEGRDPDARPEPHARNIEWREVRLTHSLPKGRYDLQLTYSPDGADAKAQRLRTPALEIVIGE